MTQSENQTVDETIPEFVAFDRTTTKETEIKEMKKYLDAIQENPVMVASSGKCIRDLSSTSPETDRIKFVFSATDKMIDSILSDLGNDMREAFRDVESELYIFASTIQDKLTKAQKKHGVDELDILRTRIVDLENENATLKRDLQQASSIADIASRLLTLETKVNQGT